MIILIKPFNIKFNLNRDKNDDGSLASKIKIKLNKNYDPNSKENEDSLKICNNKIIFS